MSLQPLPVILSRPHGGLDTPPEIVDDLAIDQTDLYNDCDLRVDQLFDFDHPDLLPLVPAGWGPGVLATASMSIARALIDVNRPLNRLDHPDGPIKTQTSYGTPIYRQPLQPTMRQRLLDRYWRPYHAQVRAALYRHAGRVQLFIDCHNMAQHGPAAYRDAGQPRPLICIANLGDEEGEPRPEFGWTMCPGWVARKAAAIAEDLFADLTLLAPEPGAPPPTVLLNAPFGGSYVAAHHLNPQEAERYAQTAEADAPFAIMIEVNRGLLVGDQHARTAITSPNVERIAVIRAKLYQWMARVLAEI